MKSTIKLFLSVSVTILLACGTGNLLRNVSYTHRVGLIKYTYTMEIPKGYDIKYNNGDGEDKSEKQFWYSDSSVIYISDFENNLNYENLRDQPDLYTKDAKAFAFRDTLELEGKTRTGLYWKNIRYNNVSIGYNNVNLQKKPTYDNCLKTLK